MDIALESGQLHDFMCFRNNAFDASGTHGAPLVECQRTEVAAAEASAVVRQRELYLGNRGNAAVLFIHRMIGSCIGKRVDPVEHFAFQRRHRRVLDKHFVVVILDDGATVDGVLVAVLFGKCFRIQPLVCFEIIVIPAADMLKIDLIFLCAEIDRTADIADLFDRNPAVKQFGKADEDRLTHAVGQNIRAGIDEDRAANTVIPIVVMCKTAQRCFQSSENDRHITERLTDAVAVDDDGAVGTIAHLSAGRVVVIASFAFGRSIMCDHRVDVASRDEKSESGSAEALEIIGRFIVRLTQHGNTVALCLQYTGNDRRAE